MAPTHSIYLNQHTQSVSSDASPVDPAEIQAFHASLPSYSATPLVPLPRLESLGFGPVCIKDESSRLGLPSFKILGASYAAFRALSAHLSLDSPSLPALRAALDSAPHRVTLYAATDGNHGRAVARAGTIFGVSRVKVLVPADVPAGAIAAIRSEGAEVDETGASYDAAVQMAWKQSQGDAGGVCVQDTAWAGYEVIPEWIVQGYATLLHELSGQLAGGEPALFVVPVGVGSLAQAVTSYYKRQPGATRILAVEPDAAPCLSTSLAAGCIMPVDTRATIMTGLNCGTVSTTAWPVLKSGVDACVTVGDDEVRAAMAELEGMGVRAGACGAAGLAALKRLGEREVEALGLMEGRGPVVLLCTEGRDSA